MPAKGAPDVDIWPGQKERESKSQAKEGEEEGGEEVNWEDGLGVDDQVDLPHHAGVDGGGL